MKIFLSIFRIVSIFNVDNFTPIYLFIQQKSILTESFHVTHQNKITKEIKIGFIEFLFVS